MIFFFFSITMSLLLPVVLYTERIVEIENAGSVEALQKLLDEATSGNRSADEMNEAILSFTANPTDCNAMDNYRMIHRNRVLYREIPTYIRNFPGRMA